MIGAWIIINNWNYGWHSHTPWKYYAKRNIGAERSTVYLHREVMMRAQPAADFALHVDHINGQSLDNRKANLRWVTPAENRRNTVRRASIPSLEQITARLAAQWRATPVAAALEQITVLSKKLLAAAAIAVPWP